MLNCIGGLPSTSELLAIPGVRLHNYGKPVRAGRKVGHVTVLELEANDPTFAKRTDMVRAIVKASWRR
jgi:5-(carboxyamino)imidazole ribonucleotide synthase